jgi:hypothetical protein
MGQAGICTITGPSPAVQHFGDSLFVEKSLNGVHSGHSPLRLKSHEADSFSMIASINPIRSTSQRTTSPGFGNFGGVITGAEWDTCGDDVPGFQRADSRKVRSVLIAGAVSRFVIAFYCAHLILLCHFDTQSYQ